MEIGTKQIKDRAMTLLPHNCFYVHFQAKVILEILLSIELSFKRGAS